MTSVGTPTMKGLSLKSTIVHGNHSLSISNKGGGGGGV